MSWLPSYEYNESLMPKNMQMRAKGDANSWDIDYNLSLISAQAAFYRSVRTPDLLDCECYDDVQCIPFLGVSELLNFSIWTSESELSSRSMSTHCAIRNKQSSEQKTD